MTEDIHKMLCLSGKDDHKGNFLPGREKTIYFGYKMIYNLLPVYRKRIWVKRYGK